MQKSINHNKPVTIYCRDGSHSVDAGFAYLNGLRDGQEMGFNSFIYIIKGYYYGNNAILNLIKTTCKN